MTDRIEALRALRDRARQLEEPMLLAGDWGELNRSCNELLNIVRETLSALIAIEEQSQ